MLLFKIGELTLYSPLKKKKLIFIRVYIVFEVILEIITFKKIKKNRD